MRRLLCALTITAGVAAACGDDGGAASDDPTTTSSAADTTSSSADPATSPAPSQPGDAPPPQRQACEIVEGEPGPAGEVALEVEVVAEGLEVPWGLAFLPSGDLLVTERPGRLRLIRDGEVVAPPVQEIAVSRPPPLFGLELFGSEGGLLGVLLHPDFAENRQFYLFYNTQTDDEREISRIERYVLADDALSATLDTVILDDIPAGLHHQGGRMHVGPDGMLYVGVGSHDPPVAQDPDNLAGKILRMDLDGNIPADNPEPDSYVYISGVRNSQGYDWFDDDHLLMVEHGPSGLELDMPDLRGLDEINVARAGDNLGWPEIWGCDEREGLLTPLMVWQDAVPPTGALFYRGDHIPEWQNSFLLTTVGAPGSGQHLHRIEFEPDNPYVIRSREVYLHREYGRLRTIVADSDGVLYVMTSNCDNRGECPAEGDKILRLGPAG